MGENALPVFRASYGGSVSEHFRFGRDMGRAFRSTISARLAILRSTGLPRPFDLALHEARFPEYVAELRGLANGSGLAFDTILRLNLDEEAAHDLPSGELFGCSDSVFSSRRRATDEEPDDRPQVAPPVVGHNEDNSPADKEKVFLADVAFDGAWFVALTYAGELPTSGFGWNADVAFTTDYVEPLHYLEEGGFARNFVSRSMLAARSPDDAMRLASAPHIAGHNYQVFNKTHFFAGEVGRDEAVFRRIEGPLFKANEYDWLAIPQRIGVSTVHRTTRALAQLPAPRTASDVLAVLWDDNDVDGSGRYGIYCDTCTLCTALFDGPRVTIYVDRRRVWGADDWAVRPPLAEDDDDDDIPEEEQQQQPGVAPPENTTTALGPSRSSSANDYHWNVMRLDAAGQHHAAAGHHLRDTHSLGYYLPQSDVHLVIFFLSFLLVCILLFVFFLSWPRHTWDWHWTDTPVSTGYYN